MQLDPLGSPPPGGPELTPEFHGISEADLESDATPAEVEVEGDAEAASVVL